MLNDTSSRQNSNFLYAAAYAGFVGAGVLAIFFLLRDALLGSPLQTPSLFAAAIFEGSVPSGEATVRLDWIALVSLVHVALFTSVGAPFAYLIHRINQLRESPLMMSLGIFAILGVGIVCLDAFVAPGLVTGIGAVSVTVGNALTAVGMTLFYRFAFHESPVPAAVER